MTHKQNFAKTLIAVVRRPMSFYNTQLYHITGMTVERNIVHDVAAESHGVPLLYTEPLLLTG